MYGEIERHVDFAEIRAEHAFRYWWSEGHLLQIKLWDSVRLKNRTSSDDLSIHGPRVPPRRGRDKHSNSKARSENRDPSTKLHE